MFAATAGSSYLAWMRMLTTDRHRKRWSGTYGRFVFLPRPSVIWTMPQYPHLRDRFRKAQQIYLLSARTLVPYKASDPVCRETLLKSNGMEATLSLNARQIRCATIFPAA